MVERRLSKFKCLFSINKARFYKAFDNIFGKIGHNASEEVLFALIKSKCLLILLYGIEACPTNSADLHSHYMQFTMNKMLFKIFGAMTMSKEMFREISKYFGINPLEEVTSAHRGKFLKRYCALDLSLIHI